MVFREQNKTSSGISESQQLLYSVLRSSRRHACHAFLPMLGGVRDVTSQRTPGMRRRLTAAQKLAK